MEYIDGVDLSKLLKVGKRLRISDACELVHQAALALDAIHRCGLVHRDVKPSNLMLCSDGLVKLLDMGLARELNRAHALQRTDDGQLLGTVDYMAPEQIKNATSIDIRADVYSLGCTLYKLLTGFAPFESVEHATVPQKLMAHCSATPLPIRKHRAEVTVQLESLIVRMLAKAPEDRPSCPAEVAAVLAPFGYGSDLKQLASLAVAPQGDRAVKDSSDTTCRIHSPTSPIGRRFRPAGNLLWLGAFATVALLVLVIWVSVAQMTRRNHDYASDSSHRSPSRNSLPMPLVDHPLEREPLVWHRLLAHPAQEVFWPHGDGLSEWRQDFAKEQISADCNGRGLLELGRCDEEHFKLQIGLNQSRWTSGLGLFFGLQNVGDTGDSGLVYQLLEVRRASLPEGSEIFSLFRSRVQVRFDEHGRRSFDTYNIGSSRITPTGQMLLEIEIRHGRLANVSVDGVPIPSLVTSPAAERFADDGHRGGFGCSIAVCAGVFRDARIMLLSDVR